MVRIDTCVQIKLPYGYCGLIKSRSGLAANHQIEVMGGVLDFDYVGTVKILLINHGTVPYNVKMFDKIAQLLVVKLHQQDVWFKAKDETKVTPVHPMFGEPRGQKGFGSTGK